MNIEVQIKDQLQKNLVDSGFPLSIIWFTILKKKSGPSMEKNIVLLKHVKCFMGNFKSILRFTAIDSIDFCVCKKKYEQNTIASLITAKITLFEIVL